jgi:hypothetical protein
MANGTDTIIIRGGSVEVEFVGTSPYSRDSANDKKYKNETMKIRRVLITGAINYDSDHDTGGKTKDGLMCEIQIFCS